MQPRTYEIRKTQKWSGQSGLAWANTPEEALEKAARMNGEDGYVVRIREYELSGMPGIRPVRPDRFFSVEALRAEVAREALERELRLDEERIADQMEADELHGITAPDY